MLVHVCFLGELPLVGWTLVGFSLSLYKVWCFSWDSSQQSYRFLVLHFSWYLLWHFLV